MSLLQLPAEILSQVLDYVGSSYFREDLGHLTICKLWFCHARNAYLKDLRLCQNDLQRLLASGHVEDNLRLVKDNLESLHLDLRGFEDWDSPTFEGPPWNGARATAVLPTWTTMLNNDLTQLANTAREARKLRELRIRTLSENHPALLFCPRRNYLSTSTMRSFLSLESLTVLELDLCGTELISEEDATDSTHICPLIGALLTSLQCLRLRMRRICADALRPLNQDSVLRLSEVIINLRLYEHEGPIMTHSLASLCGTADASIVQLHADIEHEAIFLVFRMISPKTVRVLSHRVSHGQMTSLDVLTGRRMMLADDAAWDDDGEPAEDDAESQESDIEDYISTASDEV
ncbi:hypothetical protein EJ08DRAFT_586820 [Tothia fuscella]|uniref:F-box domain-containing protein n=1 Tax=Tothia fuscella TaxID=1048955 RepID=A0A9P4U097_9PEZI|nr:hypothetical protein EJ08DRAFT_586820 [Tothia fuscella]